MDNFFWKKWRLNNDSFQCFLNMLAQITVYIELWIKESAHKYAEKGKKLLHQTTLQSRNELATMKSSNPMTDVSIEGNINKCCEVTAMWQPASMFSMQTF